MKRLFGVILTLVYSSSTFAATSNSAMIGAISEFAALITLIRAMIVAVGIYTCGQAVVAIIKSSKERGSEKTQSVNIALFIVGVVMISISFFITTAGNTIYGDARSDLAANYINTVSLDPTSLKQYVDQSTVYSSSATGNRFPEKVLKILNMFVILGGWYGIWRGFRIARIALISGSDMGGTSLAHKSASIWLHILGGVALINIESTMTIATNIGLVMVNAVAP